MHSGSNDADSSLVCEESRATTALAIFRVGRATGAKMAHQVCDMSSYARKSRGPGQTPRATIRSSTPADGKHSLDHTNKPIKPISPWL